MKYRNSKNNSNGSKKNIASGNRSRSSSFSRKNPSFFSLFTRGSMFVKVLIITILATGGLVVIGFGISSFRKKNEVLPAQSHLLDYDISSKNREQVDDLINSEIDPRLAKMSLIVNFNERELKINAKDINCHFDRDRVFNSAKKGEHTTPKLKYDENLLQKILTNFSQTSKNLPAAFSYRRNGDTLIVSPGRDGKMLDVEKTKNKVIDAFSKLEDDTIEGESKSIENKNRAIDFDKLKKEIDCEPKDACYITDKSGQIRVEKEQPGLRLDPSEKKKIVDPNNGTYRLKLIINNPKVTVETLRKKATENMNDVLASFSTPIGKGKQANAIHNIKLAISLLNGTVLLPGEEFSFSPITKHKGYKKAIVFDASAPNGEREEEGGGICQVSSTLFNAAVFAKLGILERSPHSYRVKYVPPGRDAAVSKYGKNLRIRNDLKTGIRIIGSVSPNAVNIKILGKKMPGEKYEVSFESETTASTPTYVSAKATQTIKQNGAIIKQRVFHSRYLVRDKDIRDTLNAEKRKAEEARQAEEAAKAAEAAEAAKHAEEAKQAEEEAAKAAKAAEEAKQAEEAKKIANINKKNEPPAKPASQNNEASFASKPIITPKPQSSGVTTNDSSSNQTPAPPSSTENTVSKQPQADSTNKTQSSISQNKASTPQQAQQSALTPKPSTAPAAAPPPIVVTN